MSESVNVARRGKNHCYIILISNHDTLVIRSCLTTPTHVPSESVDGKVVVTMSVVSGTPSVPSGDVGGWRVDPVTPGLAVVLVAGYKQVQYGAHSSETNCVNDGMN